MHQGAFSGELITIGFQFQQVLRSTVSLQAQHRSAVARAEFMNEKRADSDKYTWYNIPTKMLYDPAPLNDPGDRGYDMSNYSKYSGGVESFTFRRLGAEADADAEAGRQGFYSTVRCTRMQPRDLQLSSYDYPLPQERIAQSPVEPRHQARLLLVPPVDAALAQARHGQVWDLQQELQRVRGNFLHNPRAHAALLAASLEQVELRVLLFFSSF